MTKIKNKFYAVLAVSLLQTISLYSTEAASAVLVDSNPRAGANSASFNLEELYRAHAEVVAAGKTAIASFAAAPKASAPIDRSTLSPRSKALWDELDGLEESLVPAPESSSTPSALPTASSSAPAESAAASSTDYLSGIIGCVDKAIGYVSNLGTSFLGWGSTPSVAASASGSPTSYA